MCPILSYQNIAALTPVYPKVSLLLYYMCAKRIKFLMTRLSVCGLGVSCNEMNDTPMLLVVKNTLVSDQSFCFLIVNIATRIEVRSVLKPCFQGLSNDV